MENKKKIIQKEYVIHQQPWSTFNEWKSCYDLLFNNQYNKQGFKINKIDESLDSFINNLNLENLKLAQNILSIWKIRNENSLTLTTSLLLDEIIKISEKQILLNSEDNKHILSQKIIRVTNLLIDDLKKKNRNLKSNMFLVAKEIDFPEFIVEIRHSCTHKNLPQESTLLFVIKYLYYWIKENIWDKQYDIHTKEIYLSDKIILITKEINNLTTPTKIKKFEYAISDLENLSNENELNFELENIFKIIQNFVSIFMGKITIKNNIVLCENLNEFTKIYKFLQNVEGKLIPLLFFKFISQQLIYFIQGLIDNYSNCSVNLKEKESQLRSLCFIANFCVKFDIVKENYKKNSFTNLITSIYKILFFAKDFSSHIAEIFNFYSKLIKDVEIDEDKIKISSNDNNCLDSMNDDSETNSNENFLTDFTNGSLIFQQLNFLANNPDKQPNEFYNRNSKDNNTDEQNNIDKNDLNDDMMVEDSSDYLNEINNTLII